jgi:hypothetical protein
MLSLTDAEAGKSGGITLGSVDNKPVAWNYNDPNHAPNTITFNNVKSNWVMQITADRKIIVNEDVEVSEAAQAVLDALQPLLLKARPAKTLTDEEIVNIGYHYGELGLNLEMIRAILRKAQGD